MRIAILSGIHGNIHALEAVHRDLQTAGVEAVYCLGDLVGYGAAPDEVVNFIREYRYLSVMGNFDEAVGFGLYQPGCRVSSVEERLRIDETFSWTQSVVSEANRMFLQTLPLQIRFQVGSKRVLMVHGSPRNMREYLAPDLPGAVFEQVSRLAGSDVLCVGHSKQPFHRRAGTTSILNPGLVGLPCKGPFARYAVLDITWRVKVDFRSVEYDVQLAARALQDHGLHVPFGMGQEQINDKGKAALFRLGRADQTSY